MEITEDAPSDLEQSLYRHPDSRGSSRSFYRKQFDLFALGCILLEVSLWRTLRDILLDAQEGGTSAALKEMPSQKALDEKKYEKWKRILRGKALLLDRGMPKAY